MCRTRDATAPFSDSLCSPVTYHVAAKFLGGSQACCEPIAYLAHHPLCGGSATGNVMRISRTLWAERAGQASTPHAPLG